MASYISTMPKSPLLKLAKQGRNSNQSSRNYLNKTEEKTDADQSKLIEDPYLVDSQFKVLKIQPLSKSVVKLPETLETI
jgi:hypothetical protein